MKLKLMFHVHTRYSYDSVLEPKTIIRFAMKNKYNVISVTDHNSVAGSLAIKKLVEEGNLPIIPIVGAEYSTDKGDVIGLFLNVKDDNSRPATEDFNAVVDWIKTMEGITVLAHPFRGQVPEGTTIEQVDVIEVHNGGSSNLDNKRSALIAQEYHKPILVGSDAHFLGELNTASVVFNYDKEVSPDQENLKLLILKGQRKTYFKRVTGIRRVSNGLVQCFQMKSIGPIIELVIRLCRKLGKHLIA
jgi:predicted metal-dependent phosphoesterase TrpH